MPTEPTPTPREDEFDVTSVHVPMRDGVRLAVSILTPPGRSQARGDGGARWPAIIVFTRYGRAMKPAVLAAPFSESLAFVRHGFTVVQVDVRGTGASFGHRKVEKGRIEIEDYREIFDWAAAEPWCDGRLLSTGVSYLGNAAEASLVHDHPALVAVAPRFTDFDIYEHLLAPGGMPNISFATAWSAITATLDKGAPADVDAVPANAVDGDDGTLYRAAVAEHADNADLAKRFAEIVYRGEGSAAATGGDRAVNLCEAARDLERGARPAFHWGSWMDAGTAAGLIARFHSLDAPQRVKIGAWTHGAMQAADPFHEGEPLAPTRQQQVDEIARFFNDCLAGTPPLPRKSIEYVTMGSGVWSQTDVWPPRSVASARLYLAPGNSLADTAPTNAEAADTYTVDPTATTGRLNRWTTQVGTDIHYGDRAPADARLLTYTAAPLAAPITLTGTPLVTLHVASSHADGNFIAYLEAVAPDGLVVYLTEGGLRALHRGPSSTPPLYVRPGPPRSFRRADGAPLPIGTFVDLCFPLLPLSARIPAGYALRLALSGADEDIFADVTHGEAPRWRVARSIARASFIDLPVDHNPVE
ncbi:Putative serine esterase [Alphaproteobacteria bacterium SO-S41]|nr:Putative serine esterase [Alphaproteobacteria bacterium SO-S41]